MRENLVPAEEIDEAWRPVAMAIRQKCLGISKKAAPHVLTETTLSGVEDIIATFVKEALSEIASLEVAPRVVGSARSNDAGQPRRSVP